MHKEPNKRLIGIFMVSGILALLTVFSVYLNNKFFNEDENNLIVMYFEESIKGLNVGASVVFKGVEIGKVAKIELLANPENMDFSIPVYARMESYQGVNSQKAAATKREILDVLIKKGLRARLTSQSYLTGQLMVELEMLPDTPIRLKEYQDNSGILEIPTALSPIGEISKGIQNLPIKDSVEQFNKFFTELNRQLPLVMPQVNQAAANLNAMVKENSEPSAEAINNFNQAMINVSGAAKSFKNFADFIERHPEAILKGKRGY